MFWSGVIAGAGARGVSAFAVPGDRAGLHGEHDMLVLDIGLPGIDGIEVCARVREERPAVP